jgi:hypothetical protein
MKSMLRAKRTLPGFCTLFSLLVTGCCRFQDCGPCIDPAVRLLLNPSGDYCADTIPDNYKQVHTFDLAWNARSRTFLGDECDVWAIGRWFPMRVVFYLDSLPVDTVTLLGYTPEAVDDKGCCSCPGMVKDFVYEYKGITQTKTGDVLQLPF